MKVSKIIITIICALTVGFNVCMSWNYGFDYKAIGLEKPIEMTYPCFTSDVGDAYAIDSATVVDTTFYYLLKQVIDENATSKNQNVIIDKVNGVDYLVGLYDANNGITDLENDFCLYFKIDDHNVFVRMLLGSPEMKFARKQTLFDKRYFSLLPYHYRIKNIYWIAQISYESVPYDK